ncbi:uncharacterized protein A4U43_C03F12680 [Asparagus officinalis]|uniref:WRC domain-containing protein n=1 Tax=Asparagus officinalis TaxID=4686 RepID=A0A5P1F9J6_ASPOF|nr:uncharacterized protein A4U43_C03F12680 [Asparagus officinalis]
MVGNKVMVAKNEVKSTVSDSSSKVLPPKKRNVEEGKYEDEKAFPLKKRRSVLSVNQEESKKKKIKIRIKTGAEEKPTITQHDIGIEISNPIGLIAMAASWVTDSEVNQDIVMPQAYAVSEKQIIRKKPRLKNRRPRAYNNISLLATNTVAEELRKDDDDLYSKVKRRRENNTMNSVKRRDPRCTRVNGKGWRCSRLTKVGYALCDHHLGKLGNVADPKQKPGRKAKTGDTMKDGIKMKFRSMESILENSDANRKW